MVGESRRAEVHLISLQEDLREFATIPEYRIFSPWTKRMLTYQDLKKELLAFRKDICLSSKNR